jgi:5-hydroxyisourate hydrolase
MRLIGTWDDADIVSTGKDPDFAGAGETALLSASFEAASAGGAFRHRLDRRDDPASTRSKGGMMTEQGGGLTTHVLDTTRGKPGAGLKVELFRLDGESRTRLKSVRTNADGRCDGPLLAGAELEAGVYELVFHVAEHFAAAGVALPDPPFLDIVPLRFGIADPAKHYHVPLLISPWSYSTYRGS